MILYPFKSLISRALFLITIHIFIFFFFILSWKGRTATYEIIILSPASFKYLVCIIIIVERKFYTWFLFMFPKLLCLYFSEKK